MAVDINELIFSNKHKFQIINDTESDVVSFGKILFYRKDWQIRFSCDFCDKELQALPELLQHAFKHYPNLSTEKTEQLTSDNEEVEECSDEFAELIEVIEMDDAAESEEVPPVDASEKVESSVVENKTTFSNTYETFVNKINKEPEPDPEETNEFPKDLELDTEADEEDAIEYENITENIKSNNQFEFFDVTSKESPSNAKLHLKCTICHLKCSNRAELLAHRKSHGEKPYICEICDAAFKEKHNLKVHRSRHFGIKPFKCKMCDQHFTTSTDRNIHMRKHTGERYVCDDCGKTFLTRGLLTLHRRRHTNNCSYLCNICGKSFYERYQLRDHIHTHSTERPHECAKCNARFKSKKHLRTHTKLHSNEKTYACKYCTKTFAQHAGVYLHEKNVHEKRGEITNDS